MAGIGAVTIFLVQRVDRQRRIVRTNLAARALGDSRRRA